MPARRDPVRAACTRQSQQQPTRAGFEAAHVALADFNASMRSNQRALKVAGNVATLNDREMARETSRAALYFGEQA